MKRFKQRNIQTIAGSQQKNEALQKNLKDLPMGGPVRLADVAKAAGVSLGTASNVFNKPEGVRPAVRERVEQAARDLGYAGPDPKGRVLMGGRVNAIGVINGAPILSALENAYLRTFMAGVAEVCDESSAALVTISSFNDTAAAFGVRTALVDGFILHNPRNIPSLVELAKSRRLPVVTVDSERDPLLNSINLDNHSGARDAARHLLTLGHRRFAILSMLPPVSSDRRRGPFYHAPGSRNRQSIGAVVDARERLLGYADALAEAGLSIDQAPIVEAYLNPPGVSDGARMLLNEAPKATAILATADNLALGVISEARHRGIAVPRDLSVVGWDDVVEAVSAEPPLTTVAQPIKEKGRIAARIVLNPPPRPRHEILPVRLVVRASTGPAPD